MYSAVVTRYRVASKAVTARKFQVDATVVRVHCVVHDVVVTRRIQIDAGIVIQVRNVVPERVVV